MKRIYLLVPLLIGSMMLVGCEPIFKRNSVVHEEVLKDVTFDRKSKEVVVTVTTDKRTYVWTNYDKYASSYPNLDFYKYSGEDDVLKYYVFDNGDIGIGMIYLTDEGIKKYSKQYAEETGEMLDVKEE